MSKTIQIRFGWGENIVMLLLAMLCSVMIGLMIKIVVFYFTNKFTSDVLDITIYVVVLIVMLYFVKELMGYYAFTRGVEIIKS